MTNQLRLAVEKKRKHCIRLLRESGVFHPQDRKPDSLTLSELENMIKQISKPKTYK